MGVPGRETEEGYSGLGNLTVQHAHSEGETVVGLLGPSRAGYRRTVGPAGKYSQAEALKTQQALRKRGTALLSPRTLSRGRKQPC